MRLFWDGMYARNRNCYFVFVLVTVSFAVSKYLSRTSLKEEGFILADNLRKAMLSQHEGMMAGTRGSWSHCLCLWEVGWKSVIVLGSLCLSSLKPQPVEKCSHIYIGWIFPPQLAQSRNSLRDMCRGLSLR